MDTVPAIWGDCTPPLEPKIKVSIMGEPKLNEPFTLTFSVADAKLRFKKNTIVYFRLSFNQKHIAILEGATEWKMKVKDKHAIRMKVTEPSHGKKREWRYTRR